MKVVPGKKATGVNYDPVGGYEKEEARNNYVMSKKAKAERKKKRKAERKSRRRRRHGK